VAAVNDADAAPSAGGCDRPLFQITGINDYKSLDGRLWIELNFKADVILLRQDVGMTQERPIDDIAAAWHPKVREIYGYWQRIRPAADRLPGRQHFDPLDVPRLLPLIWMVDVHREPLRFRYRLIGTQHVTAMNRDMTGLWLDEVHPTFLTAAVYKHYLGIVADPQPSYRKGRPGFNVHLDLYSMERVMLPMARDGFDVDMILALTVYYRADGSEAFPTPR
jgi:hypothetical protein